MSEGLIAWRIELAPNRFALVARQALGHLADEFDLLDVPLAPAYANTAYYWNGSILPVANLSAWTEYETPPLLGLLAYRYGEKIQQAGVALFSAPVAIEVPSEQCDWPDDDTVPWPSFADCCVEVDDQVLPILNADKLFSLFSESA